jgi:hypothetical protein
MAIPSPAACVLWCAAIDRAVRDARLDGIRDGLNLLPAWRRQSWSDWLYEAETRPAAAFSPNGFVVRALQAAHAAITQTPVPARQPCTHLQAALKAAVGVGDDTDTVAAIAGSLLGARWGASAVPLAWRSALHGWPGYRSADLVRLAVLAARHGEDDAHGWPSCRSMAPYYQASYPSPPIATVLPDDSGVAVANIGGLSTLPFRADVVLSLCRMGRSEPPASAEHHHLWLVDSTDPADNPNLEFLLAGAARAIDAWRKEGRTIAIHCVQAESRTPTVAAAYLARRLGISDRDAMERARRVLPGARPNAAFVQRA